MSSFSRNFNHHMNCREKTENFQTVWTNIFLILTRPSLLQTLIFGDFVCYQSISAIFTENKSIPVALKFQIYLFCLTSILHVQCQSKIDSGKLSTSFTSSFLTELTFLNETSVFFRNWKHYWTCREKAKNFQTVTVLIFWNFVIF